MSYTLKLYDPATQADNFGRSLNQCPVYWQNFVCSFSGARRDTIVAALRLYNGRKLRNGEVEFDTEEDAIIFKLRWL